VVITPDTVKEKLKQLNVSKAACSNKIYLRVLKEISDVTAMPLYHYHCKSPNDGTLPSDRKLCHISPIFKKGSKQKANNYAEAFDSVPHRRLLAKLETYGIRG